MINKNQRALLWLNAQDLSIKRKHILLSLVDLDNCYRLYDNLEIYKDDIIFLTSQEVYDKLLVSRHDTFIEVMKKEIAENDVKIVALCDEKYPILLKEIDMPPIILYCKGNVDLLNSTILAIIGTRLPTRYGKDVTEEFARNLSRAGFTLISGMARGVDSIVHKTVTETKAPQIAVLGSGLDEIYPPENKTLFNEIVKDGLVISEYRIGTKPLPFHFPERNRIISGLSMGVLVTEAGKKSGTMITINCAIEQNRRIYVVPGNIYSKQSKGTNECLKNLQGALVTDIEDIVNDFNVEFEKEVESPRQMDMIESQIYDFLSKEERHIEEIIEHTGQSVNQLNPVLMKMEIEGLIKKLYGNYYGV